MGRNSSHRVIRQGVGAIILAGGNSNRMGYPKTWMHMPGGATFLEHLVMLYFSFGCERIVVVLNHLHTGNQADDLERIRLMAKVVENENPDRGRMYSLRMACKEVRDMQQVFIQNVDSPGILSTTLELLINDLSTDDYVVPGMKGRRGHPILLSKEVILRLGEAKDGDTLRDFLAAYTRRIVSVEDPGIFQNVNTPADYQFVTGRDRINPAGNEDVHRGIA